MEITLQELLEKGFTQTTTLGTAWLYCAGCKTYTTQFYVRDKFGEIPVCRECKTYHGWNKEN